MDAIDPVVGRIVDDASRVEADRIIDHRNRGNDSVRIAGDYLDVVAGLIGAIDPVIGGVVDQTAGVDPDRNSGLNPLSASS
jgi:hypothetical protein